MATPDGTSDAIDLEILRLLQANGRISNAEVARAIGLAPSAVLERVRKLESRGAIRGYTALLEPRQFGLGLVAFVLVRAEEPVGSMEAGQRLAEIPEVLEVHHIAGEDCYMVKVRTADPESLGALLRERFGAIRGLRSTRTTIVLSTVKDSTAIPVPKPVTPREKVP
jgi:Lrp/AsnC family leucine-responsive transcriptional regulator